MRDSERSEAGLAFERFVWPKVLPPLTPEQQRVSDDFYRHWHEVLPNKYRAIEEFNHSYPRRMLPDMPRPRTAWPCGVSMSSPANGFVMAAAGCVIA